MVLDQESIDYLLNLKSNKLQVRDIQNFEMVSTQIWNQLKQWYDTTYEIQLTKSNGLQ